MKGVQRHSLIKALYSTLPHGSPFDLDDLKSVDVSAKLAARYVESGWLVRLGHGVYAFPGDTLGLHGCIKLLQKRTDGLHIAGKSALALQGVRHNIGVREQVVLWGDLRFVLPEWFVSRFSARYSHSQLFHWRDATQARKSLGTPPGVMDGLLVSIPERAVLEMLAEAGRSQGMEEARNIFDGFRSPRVEILGNLLTRCTRIKAVRLFLTWARETQVVDVDHLLASYEIPVGSGSRWMTRLKDGTLLSLKPNG
ncbi:hypothetical protein DB345_03280 [Spartobacteria bacterium LR76]|nr:hypothetical protein DB345_03280 [Spartobacteria bacterium LR76]